MSERASRKNLARRVARHRAAVAGAAVVVLVLLGQIMELRARERDQPRWAITLPAAVAPVLRSIMGW